MSFSSPGPDDVGALFEFFEAASPGSWSRQALVSEIGSPHTRALWLPGVCAALGTVALDQAELHLIAVAAERRGQGEGARLLAALEAVFLRAGAGSVWLEVRVGNPAQRFYERAGYRAIGVRRGYYRDGGDARVMTHDLIPRQG
jgi:ribosomal protein S18 acetylase RimI-like enzyme